MTNAKKEFRREEVQQLTQWARRRKDYILNSVPIIEVLEAFADRLAEDEASKSVWVNGEFLERLLEDSPLSLGSYSHTKDEYYDTPLYVGRKK